MSANSLSTPTKGLIDKKQNSEPNNIGLQLCFGGYSSAGKKAENQDAFAALTPTDNDIIAKGAVATIADGVSSASNAAQAAQLSVTQFISDFYATPATWSTQKSAAKVLNSLNQWLYSQTTSSQYSKIHNKVKDQHSEQQEQQWLTTFSALIVKSATGYIFHVGDTRISRYRQQQLETITQDHNRKAILTRALGADSRLQVDVHQIDLQKSDIFLLTCDGVHDFLTRKELQLLLLTLPKRPSSKDLEQLSQTITKQAIINGSNDNVSCLLVHINNIANKQLIEIERDLINKVIPPALNVGEKIDDYQVIKVLHASTRSHLYLVKKVIKQGAKQVASNTPLVMKVPSTNFADDALYLQSFLREAWLGQRIEHPQVMKVFPAKANSQFLYHLCEYIDGQTLSQWLHDNPKPSIAQVRDIVNQTITALRAFQRLELVHRDLKPDNIMIDSFGQIKLIDYGTVLIAALDENQETLSETVPQGSFNYIAPETLHTLHSDHQSDLFSLGVIAYELLTGELPYKPLSHRDINYQQYTKNNNKQPKSYSDWHYRSIKQWRPELPIWLDIALQRATAADPKLRYQAFSEFAADLNKPNIDAVESYQNQPLLQRNPVQFWQGISLVLFIALIISLIS